MPSTEELTEMGAFNKPFRDAGVMLDADGFLASSKGARINFSEGSEPTVKRGPFELENLVAGYWMLKLDSIEQAIEWAKKIPFKKGSVEIRKVAGPEDFGSAMTEELKQQEDEIRKKQEGLRKQ
jgi:hypothetical protein